MSPSKNPTFETLAKKLGVSKMTISRALRNLPGVSDALREKIKKMAEELGYRPNPLVSTLLSQIKANWSSGYQATIAVLTPWKEWREMGAQPKGWFGPVTIFRGAQERAEKLGYTLEQFPWEFAYQNPGRLDRILRARGIYGILALPYSLHETGPFPSMDWSRYAIAGIFQSTSTPKISRVGTDEARNLKKSLQYLKECGYRRVGWVRQGTGDVRSGGIMRAVYSYYCQKNFESVPILDVEFGSKIQPLFEEWFLKNKPDSVLVSQSNIIRWIRDLESGVPERVGIFTMDLLVHYHEDCSGLNIQREEIGAGAIDLIVEQFHGNHFGPPLHPKLISIESSIHIGQTTRKIRKNSGLARFVE